jgi:hypothetical protein
MTIKTSRKYSKKNLSRKVKGGGKKNFLRDSDMDFKELIEATGKESYMSGEQLYNSFYQKSNITRDKNVIIKHLKAMKKHTKDLKDSANSIGKEVDKVIAVPYVTYVTLVTNVASRYYSRNARAVFRSKYRRHVLASSSHPILPYTHTHHPYPYP